MENPKSKEQKEEFEHLRLIIDALILDYNLLNKILYAFYKSDTKCKEFVSILTRYTKTYDAIKSDFTSKNTEEEANSIIRETKEFILIFLDQPLKDIKVTLFEIQTLDQDMKDLLVEHLSPFDIEIYKSVLILLSNKTYASEIENLQRLLNENKSNFSKTQKYKNAARALKMIRYYIVSEKKEDLMRLPSDKGDILLRIDKLNEYFREVQNRTLDLNDMIFPKSKQLDDERFDELVIWDDDFPESEILDDKRFPEPEILDDAIRSHSHQQSGGMRRHRRTKKPYSSRSFRKHRRGPQRRFKM